MAGEIITFFDNQQNFHYFLSEIGIGGGTDKEDLTGNGKFNPHTHSVEQESLPKQHVCFERPQSMHFSGTRGNACSCV